MLLADINYQELLQIVNSVNITFKDLMQVLGTILIGAVGAAIILIFQGYKEKKDEEDKLNDIRNMIEIDLNEQKAGYIYLIKYCNSLIMFFNNPKMEIKSLPNTNLINTNIYKTHTIRDYYKAFHVEYYKRLLAIYFVIDSQSKKLLIDIYNNYIDEISGNPEEKHNSINERYTRHVESIAANYREVINKIDKLNEITR